jgi:hypothetical protein
MQLENKVAAPLGFTYHIPLANSELRRFLEHLTTVTLAGAVTKTLLAPFERAKLILQTQKTKRIPEKVTYSNSFSAISGAAQREGILGLFRGNSANLWQHFLGSAYVFLTYGRLKRYFLPKSEKGYEVHRAALWLISDRKSNYTSESWPLV